MKVKGYVEKVLYRDKDTGWSIIEISVSAEEVNRLRSENPAEAQDIDNSMVCIGVPPTVDQGEYAVFSGEFTVHPSYGLRLKVTGYETSSPDDLDSLERYLGSGAIKGLGPTLASRIIRHFKEDTFRVIDENPEELSQVKGISERMAMEISDQLAEKKGMRKAMMFLGLIR